MRTLSADRAEPALGLALPTGSRSRHDRGKRLWRFRDVGTLAVLSRVALLTTRGRRLRRLCDLPAGAELNHVDGAFPTCDQVSAGKQNNLAWGGKAEQALRRRFVIRHRCARGSRRRVGGGQRLGRLRCGVRSARKAVDFVEVESMGADLEQVQMVGNVMNMNRYLP